MTILEDERESKQIDTCENCGNIRNGREVQAVGFSQESRGYYFLCFLCFGPRIKWLAPGRYGKTYWSPVVISA